MNRRYAIFVNGILARKQLTLGGAIKTAMQFFPSYVVDLTNNSVVWKGDK